MKEQPNFKLRNYSVPEHDPVIDPDTSVGKKKLISLLDAQIKPVNCFLVMAGMYANYKEWIQIEVELAQKYNKPIIGLVPWGQVKTPTYIQEAADIMVGWNSASMVKAIREYSI